MDIVIKFFASSPQKATSSHFLSVGDVCETLRENGASVLYIHARYHDFSLLYSTVQRSELVAVAMWSYELKEEMFGYIIK